MTSQIKVAALLVIAIVASAAIHQLVRTQKVDTVAAVAPQPVTPTASEPPPAEPDTYVSPFHTPATRTQAQEANPSRQRPEPISPWAAGRDLFLYTVLILLLIGGGVYLLKRLFPATQKLFRSGSLEVVGRTYVAPKQFVCLVRVGARLLVLGCTSNSINVLSEISDPDEVSALDEAYQKESAGSSSHTFRKIFAKTNLGYTKKDTDPMVQPFETDTRDDHPAGSMDTEMEKLKSTLATWRQDTNP